MDSDNSNRSSDILRNVVMGRVTEDKSATVFYAAVNPDGTHGELKKFGEGVVNISMPTMDDSVVDSFITHLNCKIDRSVSKSEEVILEVTMNPSTLRNAIFGGHLLDEIKKLVISNPPGGFILLYHPDDTDILQSCYSQLRGWGLYRMMPTELVEKGTVYYIPCDEFTRTFGSYVYGGIDNALSLFGTQTDTIVLDELATKVQQEPPVRDIPWLKKQLKHCKNPMEKKQLERELNAAFKEKKRRRKNETGSYVQ